MNEEIKRAIEENTLALRRHADALLEQADAQRKLEKTLHLIFEDRDGYINGAADSKIRSLMIVADGLNEAANSMRTAAAYIDEASRHRY